MALMVVGGDRRNGRIYLCHHYFYQLIRRVRGVNHIKCGLEGCNGTAVFCDGDEAVRVVSNHNHEPDLDEEDKLLFRHELRQQARTTTITADLLYNELAPQYPYGSSLITVEEARGLIRRERDACIPPIPQSISHLGTLLEDPAWWSWTLASNTRHSRLFRRVVHSSAARGGHMGALFILPSMSQFMPIEQNDMLYIGEIKLKPRQPSTISSALIVSLFRPEHGGGVDRTKCYTLAFALLEQWDTGLLTAVLRAFVLDAPGTPSPGCILCDLDITLRNAVSLLWPEAVLCTSHHYFTETMLHAFCCAGLYGASEESTQMFRKIIALPFLERPFITDGIRHLRTMIDQNGLRSLHPILQKAEDLFLAFPNEFGCSTFSRDKELALTKMVQDIVKRLTAAHARPSVWQYIDGIRSYDEDVAMRLQAAGRNRRADNRRRPNLRADVAGAFISNLVRNFQDGQMTVPAFFDRIEIVLKTRVREAQSLLLSQLPLLRHIPRRDIDEAAPPANQPFVVHAEAAQRHEPQPPAEDHEPQPPAQEPPAEEHDPLPEVNELPAQALLLLPHERPVGEEHANEQHVHAMIHLNNVPLAAADDAPQDEPVQNPAGPASAPADRGAVCMICQVEQAKYILIPCFHFGVCEACRVRRQELLLANEPPDPETGAVYDHSKCPVCSADVARYQPVFFI